MMILLQLLYHVEAIEIGEECNFYSHGTECIVCSYIKKNLLNNACCHDLLHEEFMIILVCIPGAIMTGPTTGKLIVRGFTTLETF